MAGPPVIFRFLSADRVQWWEPGLAVHEGDLIGLAGASWERRLLLAVAGEFCVLTRAKLPVNSQRAYLQALPYALEEGLAEEVETLHFAIGPLSEGEAPVAIINREVLASWLTRCAENNLQVAQAVPEPLLLPWEPGHWSLLVEEGRAVVRTGRFAGFACELESLALLLELARQESPEEPESLRVWGEAPSLIEGIPMESMGAGRASLLGGGGEVALDLLQGSFGRRAQVEKWVGPWRLTAILAGLVLLLQVVGLVVERWQLSGEVARLRDEQVQIYRQAVPDAVRVVNPRVQLQNRLAASATGGETGGFLALLQQVGGVLREISALRLEGLRFQAGRLDLELEGTDLSLFDELRQRLQALPGLEVEVRTTRREDRAVSRVSVQPRGSR